MTTRLAALALTVLLTGCADPASVRPRTDATGTPGASYAPNAAVLRVTHSGGGPLPGDHLPGPPEWTLYGDGRVVTGGAEPAIYPGFALPSLVAGTVDRATVDEIVEAARAAGVDGGVHDYGEPDPVADGTSTTVRLSTSEGTYEVTVPELLHETRQGDTEDRRRLREFVRKLTAGEAGFGKVRDERAYEPAALAVVAQAPYRLATDGYQEQRLPWRGPALHPGHDLGAAGTCTVVTGAELTQVLEDARKANILTRWRYEDDDWRLRFRPLLPDEETCADAFPRLD